MTEWDEIYREISNGMWFISKAALTAFVFQFYLDMRMHTDRYSALGRTAVLLRRVVLAIGLMSLAATLRAGYIWLLLLFENADLDDSAGSVRQFRLIMPLAAVLGVSAILWLMATLSNRRWGATVWASVGLLVVVTPVVAHLLFNTDTREHIRAVMDWWWHTGNWDPLGRPG